MPALLLLATILSCEEGDVHVAELCERALTAAGEDIVLQARCHATLAETCPSGAAADLQHAEAAVALLSDLPDPPLDVLANALTNVAVHGLRLGHGLAVGTLERAVALEGLVGAGTVSERAGTGLGITLKVIDDFEGARRWLTAMHTCAQEEGDDSALPLVLGHLALLECWAGEFQRSLGHAVRGREVGRQLGVNTPALSAAHVLVLAHLGRLPEARALGLADLALDGSTGFVSGMALDLRSLAATELMAGDAGAAAGHGLLALEILTDLGVCEPALARLHPDLIEALVLLGRREEAEQLIDDLAVGVEANHLPWATAMVLRCRGLVELADGNLPAGIAALQLAVAAHIQLPMPFERARTRLLLGSALVGAGRRGDARVELVAAEDEFVGLGAPVQARLAHAELHRIGGRRPEPTALTAVESRIAALVGVGQTNREVAAALFISVRTVESHLGRVYRKLGLRSRTELALRLPRQALPPDH